MATLRVGIVGYGRMGKHHAEVFSRIKGVEISAVVDPADDLQKQACETYQCAVFDDIDGMLTQRERPDIVVIATHSPLHHEQTVRALFAGCHIICEKPMADSLQECDDMVNMARLKGLKLAVHHQSVFSRAFARAWRMIVSGEIGELCLLRAYGKGRVACSDVKEIGGHLTHGMRYLAGGEVTEVYGDVTCEGRSVTSEDARRVQELYPEGRDSGVGAGDRMFGYYKFTNGVRAELQLALLDEAPATYNESRIFGYYIDVFGTKERLQLYLPHTLFRNRSPYDDWARGATSWEEVDPNFRNDQDPLLTRLFIEDFIKAIQKDRDPRVSGREGRIAMEMTLGITRAHLAGISLAIPLTDRRHPLEP
ncbi:MAG: Gfo/Idh/MocA family oxidoreductase [bacterium]|nr:Gfo/Idh/MocA family oxidoreductase [bacterium]